MPIYVCVCIGRNPNFCSGNKHDIFVAYLLSFGQTNSTNKKYNMCISFQEESTFFSVQKIVLGRLIQTYSTIV